MRTFLRQITALAAASTTAAIATFANLPIAAATQFQQQEVNQSRFIAIAAPVGQISHQLLILEQISDARSCWQESGSSPTTVEPLLLNFDFTGICGRSTDSNGYSLRVGNQDLGWQYSLRVVERNNDLILVAVSNVDRTAPQLEVGRTRGTTDGFARIELSPGWRLTRRAFNGQAVGHVYLTNDQTLASLNSAAYAARPTPAPAPRPAPAPAPTQSPTRPTTPAPSPQPGNALPPLPDLFNNGNLLYQVVVRAESDTQQAQVRAIAPDAFRVTVNGQLMMQAGLFRDRQTALNLEQQFRQGNLQAQVIPVASNRIPTPAPAPAPTPADDLPRVPVSRQIVVVDPGHGGRDPGAVGIGGLREKDVVLDISQQVSSLLEQQGIQTILTRSDDREIDLAPRVNLAERANADLFVSIHANAATRNANGAETFYYQSGYQLAQSIQRSIIEETDMIDRGVKQARFFVLTRTSMPAALVEVGFVTGTEDAARLQTASFRNVMAEAIAQGILRYIQQGS